MSRSSWTSPTLRPGRWRATFPYHWDADDLVSRRELLRFAVLASGYPLKDAPDASLTATSSTGP